MTMQGEQVEQLSNQIHGEGRWDATEHQKFLQALMAFGKNWKMIEEVVQSRSTAQVRSHAQKFFLKMHKIEKERKKNLKKGTTEPSKTDQQLTKSLLEQTISTETPSQILTFLKRQPPKQKHCAKDQPQSQVINLNEKLKHGRSQIIDDLLEGNEQESFLVTLMIACSRQNKGFSDPEQALNDMIEFPSIHRQEKEEEETSNKRKKSFSLYEEEPDEKAYYGVLKKMRGE